MKNFDKKCIKCGVDLNENNQYPADAKHSRYLCKSCRNLNNEKYFDREKRKEQSKKYYQNHKEQYKRYSKMYYQKNREKNIIRAKLWQSEQKKHFEYILNLTDEEFKEFVKEFYKKLNNLI